MLDATVLQFKTAATLSWCMRTQDQPPVYLLAGEMLDDTVSVDVRGVQAQKFLIVDSSQLLVWSPVSLDSARTRDFLVLRVAGYSERGSSYADTKLDSRLKSAIDVLAQKVVKVLFTTPGSDIFEPSCGGGILTLFDSRISLDDEAAVTAFVSQAVQSTSRYIIESQRMLSVATEDALSRVDLLRVGIDLENLKVEVTLQIVSKAGEVVTSTVPVSGGQR